METITLSDKYNIFIVNNIKGNIERLNLILGKIPSNMYINYLILTGEVFTLLTNIEEIQNISFKGKIL